MKNKTENFYELWQYVEKHKPQIENSLREHLPLAPANVETKFNEALQYALFSGGKRLRPVMTLLGAELVGGKAENFFTIAAAVEFVHTSSLIFDDLPAMDNSDERRGKTALHAQFGEGLAILVAISLLNASYGLVFKDNEDSLELAVEAHREIIECVGAGGMLGGQSIDLAMAKAAHAAVFPAGDDKFESVRNLKTSALMRLALRVGAILAGAKSDELTNLSRFAAALGDAYQLSDDLIDAAEDREIFAAKKTFAIDEGEAAARVKLKSLITEAKQNLIANFPDGNARSCLIQLADYLAERKA